MRSPVRALAARASWYRRVGVREPQNRRVEIIIVDGDTLRISSSNRRTRNCSLGCAGIVGAAHLLRHIRRPSVVRRLSN